MLVRSDDGIRKIFAPFAVEAALHLGGDFRLLFRIFHVFEEFLLAAIEGGVGNQLADASAGRGVSILILCDIKALGARFLDIIQHFVRLTPTAWTR